jgi:hypothetical protein
MERAGPDGHAQGVGVDEDLRRSATVKWSAWSVCANGVRVKSGGAGVDAR